MSEIREKSFPFSEMKEIIVKNQISIDKEIADANNILMMKKSKLDKLGLSGKKKQAIYKFENEKGYNPTAYEVNFFKS